MSDCDYYCLTDRELRLGKEISDAEFRRIYMAAALHGQNSRLSRQGKAAGNAGGSTGRVSGVGEAACQSELGQA